MTDVYWAQVRAQLAEAQAQLGEAEAARDGAYRERAQLVAWLAALHPAVLAPAPDVDEPGWQILYLTAGGRQLSWHIAPADADLFGHVELVGADDPRAQWDGHTTEEKYERIQALAAPGGAAGQHLPVAAQAVVDRIQVAWAATDDAAGRMAALSADEARMKAVVDGERRPSLLDLALIGEACGVTVDWLLRGDVS